MNHLKSQIPKDQNKQPYSKLQGIIKLKNLKRIVSGGVLIIF